MARKTGSHASTTGPKVREAAQRLIAQHGYAAISMRKIASEIGMQAGALHLYTPDKQTLLFDIMCEHMNDLLAIWQAEKSETDPLKALEQFCRFHIRYHLQRPDQVFIAYMELRNLDDENFAKIEEKRRAYELELEDILKRGQESGAFSLPDSRLATMAIIAMLTGVNTWYREGGRLTQENVESIYWNMVHRAVGA